MTDSPENLGEQLRQAIRESGLTGYELWKRSGVAEGVISRFMRGKRSPTLRTAGKLTEVLDLALVRRKKPRKDG